MCPRCGSELQLTVIAQLAQEIETGELVCQQGHEFPIVGSVPRFVESEAYVQNFGFEWNVHALTQLDTDSSDESERTFRSKTGFTPEQLRGKRVLDVGCGMGRFSDVASKWAPRSSGSISAVR